VKVVLAGNFVFPSGTAPAMRMQNMATGLAENGAKVHVLPIAPIFTSDETTDRVHQLAPNVTYELLVTTPNPLPARNPLAKKPAWLWRTYSAALKAYKRLYQLIQAGECDLLIGYGRNMVLLGPLVRLCQASGIVSLLDVVELRSQFGGFGGKLNPVYWDWFLGERILPRWFDGLLIIAEGLRPVYEAVGVRRFLRVPAIEGWNEEFKVLEKETGERPFQLTCISTLINRDAPEVLLEAMRLLSKQNVAVRLNLLGKFREISSSDRWVRLCETDPGLRKIVKLVGRVSDEELAQYFSQADGFILTRRNAPTEICSFPTRLVEYLKSGRPVFVSAVGDIPDYLQDGRDVVFLSVQDPSQAAQAIADIVTNPEKGREIGFHGRQTGATVFNRKEHGARILAFARQL
jgi:glycosyltransferase involved in cell wall biosynthesis